MTDDTTPSAPSVVAVIALYNGARFVERAIRSVHAQTVRPDEFLVVDDGSTDSGPALVAELARDVPLTLVRKANGGQSSARNFGVARSSASLIAFLDQDDFWYPTHLEELLKPFAADPSLGWSYANLDEGDIDGVLLTPSFLSTRTATHPKTSLRACLTHDMFVLPSAALVARSAFEAVGGFDERLSGYEDDDLFIRLVVAGFRNVYVDKPLSMWRIYGTSTTSTPLMTRSRMVYARKLLATYGALETGTGTLAREAIAPRFARSLLGEYVRAEQRGDRAGMDACLDDIETLFAPHLAFARRSALKAVVAVLRSHRLGHLLANKQVIGWVRKLARMPQDLRTER